MSSARCRSIQRVGGLLRRRQLSLLECHIEPLLEGRYGHDLGAGDEREAGPLLADATSAADSMHEDRRVLRQRVVDHVRQVRDVDAAGGDVGGHHEADLAALNLGHNPLALLLRQVAVEQLGVVAVSVEHRAHQRGVVARVAEDDGRRRLLLLDHVEQVARFRVCIDRVVEHVVDVVDAVLIAGEKDGLRVGQVVADNLLDVGRDGGREEQLLAVRRAGGRGSGSPPRRTPG